MQHAQKKRLKPEFFKNDLILFEYARTSEASSVPVNYLLLQWR